MLSLLIKVILFLGITYAQVETGDSDQELPKTNNSSNDPRITNAFGTWCKVDDPSIKITINENGTAIDQRSNPSQWDILKGKIFVFSIESVFSYNKKTGYLEQSSVMNTQKKPNQINNYERCKSDLLSLSNSTSTKSLNNKSPARIG